MDNPRRAHGKSATPAGRLFASDGLTALSRFSVRWMIDGGSDGLQRYNSGTGARKLPQKGNVNCQHVTLTVLFAASIITIFGQL
jgi:hypothetical protein